MLRVLLDATVREVGKDLFGLPESERKVVERVVGAVARRDRLDELTLREVERVDCERDCTERVEPLCLDDDRVIVER